MNKPSLILDNFSADDRLAVVLLNKRSREVIQRLASAESISSEDFHDWLRYKNTERFEVYTSVNALKDDAEGRTKADVGAIRHVFLDFDDEGTAAVERLLKRDDLPKPNNLISTSPDKWQVIWKVCGFDIPQAEHLQRALARQTGGDIAATDCARVLRLPGFYNHKYAQPHWVRVEKLSDEICGPDRFPKFDHQRERALNGARSTPPRLSSQTISQSEKDWSFARRSLARGDSPQDVITAIATYRRFDKHDPQYYAALTVQKAAESLAARSETLER